MADSVKIRITGDASQFNKEVSSLGDRVKSAATGAGSVLRGILGSQIITRGVSMLTGGIRSAISTGMQFEAAMSQVAAISGATGEELEKLTETARHYGETTKFTASQAAEALNYMALAGWDASQSMAALPGVLSLAAASGMDLGAASDAITDYISAFGMEASDAAYMSDLMAYAQSNANTSASQLADAYGNCASSMHAAGQDIETTTAMLMTLSNQGIKGSEAGTQMAAVMRDLTQKMENGRIMIGKTAVQVADADGNFRDLNAIMADVGAAVDGMGTAERSAAIMTTFTARSVKAINTILNEGMDSVNTYEEALRGAEGTAGEQAGTMMDNLQGDIQIFQSALEGLQITASDSFSGVARSIVQEGTGILEEMTRGGKAGGLSGMFDAAIDMIPRLLDKATQGLESLVNGISAKLPALVKKLAGQLPNLLQSGLQLTPTVIKAVMSAASGAVESLAGHLPEFVEMVFQSLPGLLESVFAGAMHIVDGLMKGIDTALGKLGLRKLRFGEILQNQIDAIDPELKKELKIAATVDYEVEEVKVVTAEEAKQMVDDAMETFRAALTGAGIDDETAAAITAAVKSGSGYDAWVAALQAWGVPETDAETVAGSIERAFKVFNDTFSELGLNEDAKNAIIEAINSGADIETLTQMLVGYGVNPIQARIAALTMNDAANVMRNTFDSLDLAEHVQTAVETALAAGAGIDDLKAMLIGYGVDETKAGEAAETLVNANSKMNSTMMGLGLDDQAEKAVAYAVKNNAPVDTIRNMLIDYGVDEEKAGEAAKSLTGANDEMNAAMSGLKLDDGGAAAAFLVQAVLQGGMVKGAIGLLDMSGVDTDSITKSYETIKTSVGIGFEELVKALHDSLTNGIPDEYDADFAQAKQDIQNYCTAAQGVIDEWEKEQIAAAEQEYTGVTLQQKITDIQAEADNMRATIKSVVDDTEAWTNDASGKPAEYVESQMTVLEGLIEQVYGIDAKMRELDANVISVNRADRLAVEQGYMTDPTKQMAAMAYTNYEYQQAVAANQNAYDQAVATAATMYADMPDLYAERVAELEKELEENNAAALAAYESHMTAITQAMLNDEQIEGVNAYKEYQPMVDALDAYTEYMSDAVDKPDLNTWEKEVYDIEAFAQKYADAIGFSYDEIIAAAENIPEGQLNFDTLIFSALAMKNGLEPSVISDLLINGMAGVTGLDGPLQAEAAKTMEGIDWGGVLAVFATAAENGILQDAENYDFSDVESVMDYILHEMIPDRIAPDVQPEVDVTPEVRYDTEETRKGLEKAVERGQYVSEPLEVDLPVTVEPDVTPEIRTDTAAAKEAEATVTQYADTVLSYLQNALDNGITTESWWSRLVSGENSMSEYVSDVFGEDWASTFDSASATEAVTAMIAALESSIATSGQELKESAKTVGEGADNGLITGMENGESGVEDAASRVGGGIADSLKATLEINSPSHVTMGIGENAALGLALGLDAKAGAVIAAAKRIADLVRQTISDALQINSPSKVMARLGEFTGEGFGLGLSESLDAAIRSAQSVVGLANLKPGPDFSGMGDMLGSSVRDIADIESERPINMYLNGKLVGRTMRPDHAAATNSYNRSFALGVGK